MQHHDRGDFKSNCSATIGVLSGGMSTNEDTQNSNGAFKKSDGSFTLISELQTTKNSNELVDKENPILSNPQVYSNHRVNRIGDRTEKRRQYQSQHENAKILKKSSDFANNGLNSKFVLPTIQTSRKFAQSNL